MTNLLLEENSLFTWYKGNQREGAAGYLEAFYKRVHFGVKPDFLKLDHQDPRDSRVTSIT